MLLTLVLLLAVGLLTGCGDDTAEQTFDTINPTGVTSSPPIYRTDTTVGRSTTSLATTTTFAEIISLDLVEAEIEDAEVTVSEALPAQVEVEISGTVATPCHEVVANVEKTDESYEVTVWQIQTGAQEDCQPTPEPFVTSVLLGDSFAPGDYRVEVNGEPYSFTVS